MIKYLVSTTAVFSIAILLGACSDGSDDSTLADPGGSKPLDLCNLPVDDIVVSATEAGIEYVRTPDECFDALVDFPFEPRYVTVDGLRMHYVDEGPRDGETVLMLHGQPSWSYLYRKMIPVLTDAGYRVIAADHIGMGRSDKPVDPRVHTYNQQVEWNKAFIAQLGQRDITLFVQDWGSLIGLRVAGEIPDLFARIVIANGNLPLVPAGLNPFTAPVFEFDESAPGAEEFFAGQSGNFVESFQAWINYASSAPTLFAADVVQAISLIEIPADEVIAYNAPFPDRLYWGAIRAFPGMVAGVQGEAFPAYAELGKFDRPFLFLAGEFDPSLGSEENQNSWIDHVPGSAGQDHRRYEAAHFIQEDVGEEMAADVVEFMRQSPIPESGPMYKLRYCEILLVKQSSGQLTAEVYNTQGLNDCPQEAWDAVDLGAIAAEHGALFALRNGPRFWLIDVLEPIADDSVEPIPGFGDVETFGELDLRLVATVEVNAGSAGEPGPYLVNEVARSTVFTFVPGRRIFELEDGEGRRYVMQSMSQAVDPELQPHDLIGLGERLDLPAGWTYSTRILQEQLELRAEGIARVVTDDFSNTYQMVE